MTQNQNQNILSTLTRIVYMNVQCLDFFQQVDSKEFDLNKYTSNISKGCFLEVDLEFSKESRELQDDYPLAPDKIELKREMLSEYQLKIVDLYSILIDNVKKVVSVIRNVFASL